MSLHRTGTVGHRVVASVRLVVGEAGEFGVRGDVNVDLTVYGPLRPLHSGHYGNWAPNPIMLLVELIASMRSPDGTILAWGLPDGIVRLYERRESIGGLRFTYEPAELRFFQGRFESK